MRTAVNVQLSEAQKEVEAERENRSAAELALETQKRESRAAEYARMRSTSPHRDSVLHSELARLRHQVCWHA